MKTRQLSAREIEPLIEGAMGVLRTDGAVQPIRLPAGLLEFQHRSLRSPFTAEAAAGVRLRFRTTARSVSLCVDHLEPDEHPGQPDYDLIVDGAGLDQWTVTDGRSVRFSDLPAGDKIAEIWLPTGLGVRLRTMTVDASATVTAAPNTGSRWVVYGSSITQGAWTRPTETWPAISARALGWHLTCLGYNGGCHLDPFVARAMAAAPADRFTLKVGVNVHNLQTLRERTFAPLLHGFVATLRDHHPTVPITLVSPIVSPDREDTPVSDVPVASGTGPALVGDLTLSDMRFVIQDVVDVWRTHGDRAIDHLNGYELLGPADAAHLPDGLHPDRGGHALIAERFVARVQRPD